MNYNASLDDIIKQNRSKIGLKTKKFRAKNNKPVFRPNIKKKQNPPVLKSKQSPPNLKSKFKKRNLSGVTDARVKIIQNKKNLRRKSIGSQRSPLLQTARSPLLLDARAKIDARRQKRMVTRRPNVLSRDSAITRMAPNGILQRRINPNLSNDNGIRVEYEDDEMNLENETVTLTKNWPDQFTIRRTVNNVQEKKRFPPTLMGYRDLDAEPDDEPMFYSPKDNLPLNEVTRTFTNLKSSPLRKRTYSARFSSSPVRENEEMRDVSVPKSSMTARDSKYYRIMISNLHEDVTSEDIKELFEDVGDLAHAKMIRNGMAEVAYRSEKDAMDAVEIYHNRLLDGLPMKCTLLASESLSSKKRCTRIPPVSTHSSIEPDAHIIKKALFNN